MSLALTLLPAQAPAAEPQPGAIPAPEAGAGSHRSRSYPYQEHRISGRLERITVTRENGVTEVYQNNRHNTLWSGQENELGEVPNMRHWIITTW